MGLENYNVAVNPGYGGIEQGDTTLGGGPTQEPGLQDPALKGWMPYVEPLPSAPQPRTPPFPWTTVPPWAAIVPSPGATGTGFVPGVGFVPLNAPQSTRQFGFEDVNARGLPDYMRPKAYQQLQDWGWRPTPGASMGQFEQPRVWSWRGSGEWNPNAAMFNAIPDESLRNWMQALFGVPQVSQV